MMGAKQRTCEAGKHFQRLNEAGRWPLSGFDWAARLVPRHSTALAF